MPIGGTKAKINLAISVKTPHPEETFPCSRKSYSACQAQSYLKYGVRCRKTSLPRASQLGITIVFFGIIFSLELFLI